MAFQDRVDLSGDACSRRLVREMSFDPSARSVTHGGPKFGRIGKSLKSLGDPRHIIHIGQEARLIRRHRLGHTVGGKRHDG